MQGEEILTLKAKTETPSSPETRGSVELMNLLMRCPPARSAICCVYACATSSTGSFSEISERWSRYAFTGAEGAPTCALQASLRRNNAHTKTFIRWSGLVLAVRAAKVQQMCGHPWKNCRSASNAAFRSALADNSAMLLSSACHE